VTDGAPLTVDSLADVAVDVTAMLGPARATIGEVLAYTTGSIVALDARADAPVPLLVNGVTVATGDVVVTEDGMLAIEISAVSARTGAI